jgi:hypothetical protein
MQIDTMPAINMQQINHNRGTRAFRPVMCGNFVMSFWSQRFSVEKITKFCAQAGIAPPPTPDLFGVSIFERNFVMGREIMQPVSFTTDPRFAHYAWSQFRSRVPPTFSECFVVDNLRVIVMDLMMYVRAQTVSSFSSSDTMVQDVTAQLEAALSLL